MITWKQLQFVGAAVVAAIGLCVQLNSCMVDRVQAAVAEQSASKADIQRLESKIDNIYNYLLEHPSRR